MKAFSSSSEKVQVARRRMDKQKADSVDQEGFDESFRKFLKQVKVEARRKAKISKKEKKEEVIAC